MSKPPPWLTAGRDFYKAAFEKRTRPGLDASIDDWMHLSPEEHAFVTNHLLYLNLLAQADQVAILEDIQARLADGQSAQVELVEALLGASAGNDNTGDDDQDDGFYEDDDSAEDFSDDDADQGFYDEVDEDHPEELEDFYQEEPDEDTVSPIEEVTLTPLKPAQPVVVLEVPSTTHETRMVSE